MDINTGMQLLLASLWLVGILAGSYLFLRTRLGQAFRAGLGWLVILMLLIAGYGLWEEIRSSGWQVRQTQAADGRIEIPRSRDGHFFVTLIVNDTPVRFLVDTGASGIVLTLEDAQRAGLPVDNLVYSGRAQTANGLVRTAPVRLRQIRVGNVVDRRLWASVNEGEMSTSLLGMSYLRRWTRMEITRDNLILVR